jgi:hypothetical protein
MRGADNFTTDSLEIWKHQPPATWKPTGSLQGLLYLTLLLCGYRYNGLELSVGKQTRVQGMVTSNAVPPSGKAKLQYCQVLLDFCCPIDKDSVCCTGKQMINLNYI